MYWALPLLALVSFADAQCGTASATITIGSQADASALASCATVSGSILIDNIPRHPPLSEFNNAIISFDGPEMVNGDVIFRNSDWMTMLSSNSIKAIGGQFGLSNMTRLSTLDFPKLASAGSVSWVDVTVIKNLSAPALTSVGSFSSGTGSLSITGNDALVGVALTALKSVGGSVSVASNKALAAASFPALTEVGGSVLLDGDFSSADISALTNVKGNVTIRSSTVVNCAALENLKSSIQGVFVCKDTNTAVTLSGSGSTTAVVTSTQSNGSSGSSASTTSTPSTSSSHTTGSSASTTSSAATTSNSSSAGNAMGAMGHRGAAAPLLVVIVTFVILA